MNIIRLKTVDSTNTYIRERRELWNDNFTTVIAEEQTGGRGRLGRKWHSGPGKDLMFSTIYCPDIEGRWLPVLTIYSGLAVAKALKNITGFGFDLKWPNDVFYMGKKIAGILCEMIEDGSRKCAIIGIGINVNSSFFPGDVSQADSLFNITGKTINLETVFNIVMDSLKIYLSKFSLPLAEDVLKEYISLCISLNMLISFEMNGGIKRCFQKSEQGRISFNRGKRKR